jgi:peptidoglycan endopeptidase LytE
MKTPVLVGVIVAVHCIAVGSAVLIQGCRTPAQPRTEPPLPPAEEVKAPPAQLPGGVEMPPADQRIAAETTTYTIKKGDTLSEIAYKYGLKVPEIMALNCMTNPNKLKVGQKVMLPGKVDFDSPKHHVTKKPKVERPAEPVEGAAEYTVKSGDSLSAIAAAHGTTVADIKKANSLTSNGLKIGQKLMIPGGAKEGKEGGKEEEKADVQKPAEQQPVSAPVAVPPADMAPSAPAVPAAPAVGDSAAPVAAPAVPAAPVQAPAPGKAPATQKYTVEPNDDLVKVSKMWGVSVEELKKVNGLTDTTLKPGQVLNIPIVE